MNDDDEPFAYGVAQPAEWRKIISDGKARARDFLANARRCDKCGKQVATPGRFRHYMCEPNTIMGHACVCKPGCSASAYGNGPVACDLACRVCRVLHDQPLSGARKGKR